MNARNRSRGKLRDLLLGERNRLDGSCDSYETSSVKAIKATIEGATA
jgi:hypothetical protein